MKPLRDPFMAGDFGIAAADRVRQLGEDCAGCDHYRSPSAVTGGGLCKLGTGHLRGGLLDHPGVGYPVDPCHWCRHFSATRGEAAKL